MYEKCITCDHVDDCPHAPRFYSMKPEEVLDWMRSRKKYLHLTNEEIANKSGVPAGTIARLFAEHSTYTDYKHTTIQPLLAALAGTRPGEQPCPTTEDPETVEMVREDYQRKVDYLKAQAAAERRSRIMMTVLCFVLLLVIICALVVDHMNPDAGFFWPDRLSSVFGASHSGVGVKTLLGS